MLIVYSKLYEIIIYLIKITKNLMGSKFVNKTWIITKKHL